MQAAMAVRQSASYDRMRDAYHAPRSQSAGGMHPRSPRSELSMENQAPMLMPSGLNSMLKNTTETGDIGMFSIKPTKLPRHNVSATLSSLPKAAYHDLAAASPDFSLSQGPPRPRMDDRRRLPSYNRDITSEIASLYETNSMKSSVSSRVFDDTEQRSYSMTRASINGSGLANHRSYASLRSQGDMSAGQRSRSPFAYPSRLKRPGFRPCSPALTDGGVVDYSKRSEIGRESSVTSPGSSNSVGSQRRMPPPPLSVRTDFNRPAPGAMGQQSPRQHKLHAPARPSSTGRRSPASPGNVPQSPLQREFNASRSPSMGRKSPAPLNQAVPASAPSPSRSVVSNGPAIPSRLRSRASSSPTAEKVPASPLYYDYTESFYPEDKAVASPVDDYYANPPAPAFMVDRTIHEDRELSSDWSYLAMSDLRGRGFLASEALNLMSEDGATGLEAQPMDFSYAGAPRTSPLRTVQVQPDFTSSGDASGEHSMTARVHGADDYSTSNGSVRTPPRWDGAGYRSTEPTPLDERGDPNEDISFVEPKASYSPSKSGIIPGAWPPTAGSLAGSIPRETRSFPFPTPEGVSKQAAGESATQAPTTKSTEETQQPPGLSQSASVPALRNTVPSDDGKFSPETVGLAISTAELTEIRESDDGLEDVFPISEDELRYQPRRVAQTDFPLVRHESYEPDGSFHEDPRFKLSKYKSDSDLTAPRFGIRENNRYTIHGPRGVHHMMHTGPRNPREFLVGSSSEIMSPIPISPARELRVKNSIPQFMKTLPPLPLRQPVGERISLTEPRKSSSKRPPPLKLDPSTLAPRSNTLSAIRNPTTPTLPTPNKAKASPKVQKQSANSSQPFFSRWRLKARSPAVVPKPSPPAARPWSLVESYPWDSTQPAVEPLPALAPKKSGLFTPKLKLRMMQSSESLGLGTVRVNRDAVQAHREIPTLGQPKDLFSSPSSGLTNIFRQVSHHLSGESGSSINPPPHPEVLPATKEAKAKNHKVTKSASKSTMTPRDKTLTRTAQQTKVENNGAMPKLVQTVSRELRVATNIVRPAEHASLRHEGSQQELHDSIRKKLRARLPMSHSRAQSRKSEDVIPRPKSAASSAPLIMAGFDGANDYIPPAEPVKRSRRLRKKVNSWFKGAKAKVLGCVRHKHATEASVDLTVPAPPS